MCKLKDAQVKHEPADTAVCRSTPLISFLISFIFLLLSVHTFAQTTPGAQFLDASVNPDGSIALASDLSEPYQSTAEALITYGVLELSDSAAVTGALAYLDTVEVDSTENLVLRMLASSSVPSLVNTTLTELVNRQNRDGGIGAFKHFGSDIVSTAFAIQAMSQAGIVNETSARAVSYLLSLQNPDGSWSLQDNPKRVETTALAANALWLYRKNYQLSNALSNGISYLELQRDSNGLWKSTEASALALLAALNVEIDRTPFQTSLANFANLQSSNGSFDNDVYLTALGLRVLDAVQKPAPDEIVVSGRVVDGDSGTPLSGAIIELSGASDVSDVSDANGEFSLNNLVVGNYSISVSVDGFGELTLNTLLTSGSKANLGNLELSRLQIDPDTGDPVTTGFVRGNITDRRTAEPIENATVTVIGTDLSALTNAAGEYQLTSVPSGAVQVTVSALGYGSVSGSANIASGQTLIFSPSLQEQVVVGVILEGVITDRVSGVPLEGVQVEATGGDGQSQIAITDATGVYQIEGIVAGEIGLQTSFPDYHPVVATTTVDDGARLAFSPQLDLLSQDPAPSQSGITGIATDAATGRGLQFVQVTLAYDSGESFTQVSGQDGEFSFTGLPQGSATITLELADYSTLSGAIDTQSGLIIDVGNIELQPENAPLSGSVLGQIVDVRSRLPINGAIVSARNTLNNTLTEVMSNAQGDFTLVSLPNGEYEITISFSDYNPQILNAVVESGFELDLGEIRLRQPGVDALLADLAIIELNNSQVQSSQNDFAVTGTVSGVVVNRGNVSVAVPFDIVAFEDIDRDGAFTDADILLGSASFTFEDSNGLNVDSTAEFSLEITGIQSFHDAPISIFVDSNNVIAELSEANNTNSTAGLCTNQQQGPSLDLAICMDSSGSVSFSEFQLQLEGTALAVENEDIVPRDGSVRLSVIQFSSSSFTELNPTVIEEDNANDVADAIRAINKRGGGTSIDSCIDTANSLITNASPESALQVIDVSTDGQSSLGAAINASNRAIDAGIDVLNSIGVGSGIDQNLLNAIVFPQPSGGDRGFVITVDNFQEYIDGIAGKIQRETRIPDLTVGGLSLIDNGTGTNATATFVIGNGGSGDISGAVVVRIYNGDPDLDGLLLLEEIYDSGLLSGESAQISVENIVPAEITSGELFVEVVLEEGFAECNQDNNRQQLTVTSLLGAIDLELNGTVFGSNSDVDLATSITNTGSFEGNYIVALTVLDENGDEVAGVASFDVAALEPAASIEFNNIWGTVTSNAGNYVARAILTDSEGNVLDIDDVGFTISDLLNPDGTPSGTPAASLRATTDRPFYHVDDEVQLGALAENITTIHPISNPRLVMTVLGPDGASLLSETVALPSLAPAQIAEAMRSLDLMQALEGVYQFELVLIGNSTDDIFATQVATFEVINDLSAAVRGAVSVQIQELVQGESQTCTLSTTNTGTVDLTALAVNYRVLNVDTQTTVTSDSSVLSLTAGESANQVQSFSTTGFVPGNYACVLEATLDGESRVLAFDQFSVAEAPINIVGDLRTSNSPRILVLADALVGQDTQCYKIKSDQNGKYFQTSSDKKVIAESNKHAATTYCFEETNGVFRVFDLETEEYWRRKTGGAIDQILVDASQESATNFAKRDCFFNNQNNRFGLSDPSDGGTPFLTIDRHDELVGTESSACSPKQKRTRKGFIFEPSSALNGDTSTETLPVISSLLDEESFELVNTAEDFELALLSGQYQQYFIDISSQSLESFTAELLREAVYRGEGLVLVRGNAEAIEKPLREIFNSIHSIPSSYGNGKGIWINYDILSGIVETGVEADMNADRDLLLDGIEQTMPNEIIRRSNGVTPVELALENLAGATPISARIQWPDSSDLIDQLPIATNETSTVNWVIDLAEEEQVVLTSWAVPAYVNGSAQVLADIFIGGDTTVAPYESFELILGARPAENLTSIRQELQHLIDRERNRNVKRTLRRADRALRNAQRSMNEGDEDRALERLLESIDHLKAVNKNETNAIRLRISEVLWQWSYELVEGSL